MEAIFVSAFILLPGFPGTEAGEAAADTIVVRADYWCPYNCTPGDPRPGYLIELMARALAPLGHDVDYAMAPWDRALADVAAGRIDAVVGATTLEAEGLVLTQPVGIDSDCFFVRHNNAWRYDGVASLEQILLGVVSGYTHDEGPIDAYIAAQEGPGGSVIAARGDSGAETNIKLLLLGRIDATLDSHAVTRYIVAQAGRSQHIEEAGCLEAIPLYIAISPKRADAATLAGAIDAEVVRMRQSGALSALLSPYGLRDWQE
jgi:polar amino acid transport system substrate-binding protein